MTCEILFRGKRVDNGEWVEGYYASIGEYHYILTGRLELVPYLGFEHFLVNPETIGQFTGLTDRNGVKIFEGDIVNYNGEPGYVGFDKENAEFLFSSKHGVQDLIAFIAIGMQKLSATSTTKCAKTAIPELLEVSGSD